MSVIDRLAFSLGDKTQVPNKELAVAIANEENKIAVSDLKEAVVQESAKRLKMDAIMTLAYVAELNPSFMADQIGFFLEHLDHPIERVGWGSMIGLYHTSGQAPDLVFDSLSKVLDGMDRDSIVGRDHGFKILVVLYQENQLREDIFYLILEQIRKVRPNQLGQYTEGIMKVLDPTHKHVLIETLEEKRAETEDPYHLRRLSKNLKKLYKQL